MSRSGFRHSNNAELGSIAMNYSFALERNVTAFVLEQHLDGCKCASESLVSCTNTRIELDVEFAAFYFAIVVRIMGLLDLKLNALVLTASLCLVICTNTRQ